MGLLNGPRSVDGNGQPQTISVQGCAYGSVTSLALRVYLEHVGRRGRPWVYQSNWKRSCALSADFWTVEPLCAGAALSRASSIWIWRKKIINSTSKAPRGAYKKKERTKLKVRLLYFCLMVQRNVYQVMVRRRQQQEPEQQTLETWTRPSLEQLRVIRTPL